MLPGFAQEVQALVASGRHFGPPDLVLMKSAVGGGNDNTIGISTAQGVANILGYVTTLAGLGARQILIEAPSADAEASVQAALVPIEIEGVGINFFNIGALVDNILADPSAYGFPASVTTVDYCAQFGGPNVCNGGGPNITAPHSRPLLKS